MNSKSLIVFLLTFIATSQASAEKITVAVASNFTAAMNDLVAEFEKKSGHHVNLAFGSSGKFYALISNGAPFQAFFSADQEKPMALEQNNFAVPGSRFTYAVGTLALWSSKTSVVDANVTVLKQGNFNKLAIANPRLAPYGVAAVEVLQRLQLKDATKSKWVLGENIAQAYQFVATGNADIGFVALSQIIDSQNIDNGAIKAGSAWIVPSTMHNPIRQDAVLLRRGENSPAARELLQFIRGDSAKKIIQSYGYQILEQTHALPAD